MGGLEHLDPLYRGCSYIVMILTGLGWDQSVHQPRWKSNYLPCVLFSPLVSELNQIISVHILLHLQTGPSKTIQLAALTLCAPLIIPY